MGAKQTIAVVGATGAQGGGLVRAILADGTADQTRTASRTPDATVTDWANRAGVTMVAGVYRK